MLIEKTTKRNQIDECIKIAKELPKYFNRRGIAEIKKDLPKCETFIAKIQNNIVGFCALSKKEREIVEIRYIAIDKKSHRKGIGSKLIKYVQTKAKKRGIEYLKVKTLDASIKYAPYVKIRNFYKKHGFAKVETIKNYPCWGRGNHCAIFVKKI